MSKDPDLLWLAKSAKGIVWTDPTQELSSLHKYLTRDGKLPKHVRQFPNGKDFVFGISLGGHYRPLGYLATSLAAALLADAVTLRIDEYRKQGIASNTQAQKSLLNFPIEYAQKELFENESLTSWWGEMLGYLLEKKILVEADAPASFIRTGRPNAETSAARTREKFDAVEAKIEKLRFTITALESTVEKLNQEVCRLIREHQQPTIFVGPSTPATPCCDPEFLRPAPLPAIPTCGPDPRGEVIY